MSIALLIASCASPKTDKSDETRTQAVTVAEFSHANGHVPATGEDSTPHSSSSKSSIGGEWPLDSDRPADGAEIVAVEGPTSQSHSASTNSAGSTTASPRSGGSLPPLKPGEQYVVDSLIGQINGRPIFADEFFQPIEDRLLAARETMTPLEFGEQVKIIVDERLQQVAIDELFISEAKASLTPEEHQSLSRWERVLRELLLAQSSGLESQAEQRAQEEGLTLDRRLLQIKDLKLVQRFLQQEIEPRIIVSWRDVEREYQRRYAEFNPAGQILFSRIRLPSHDNNEMISEVERRLMQDSFESVVAWLGSAYAGPWGPFTLKSGGVDDLPVTDENLKSQIAKLNVGETSPPIQVGATTWWLHVTSIDRPPGRSIYDPAVQAELTANLRRQRALEEQNRLIQSLFQKGVYDDLDAMRSRLLRVALLRYGR